MANSRKIRPGMQFGRLTAVKETDKKIGASYIWLCKCECGQMKEVSTHSLLDHHTKSCGCLKGGHNKLDLTGERFGHLVAITDTGLRCGTNCIWLCKCDCGSYRMVSTGKLRSKEVRSCKECNKGGLKDSGKDNEEAYKILERRKKHES